jgi:hypothetical protein
MTVGRELEQASIHVVAGHSLVVPLIIERLPPTITALGRRWQRKREFHLTAVPACLIDGLDGRPEPNWDRVAEVASGRRLGPVRARCELRRASDPEEPGLQTLIVMADCPGLEELYDDLSRALGAALWPPPAHVTLYSTDPAAGIGIADETELTARAPALGEAEQAELRRAMALP